uniref:Uncharacterized protein n=1 Tax=Arion vulgaris TaxID=1028688 RepID=A0A0B7BBT6_9EUPU
MLCFIGPGIICRTAECAQELAFQFAIHTVQTAQIKFCTCGIQDIIREIEPLD